jgi:hypothetical protein
MFFLKTAFQVIDLETFDETVFQQIDLKTVKMYSCWKTNVLLKAFKIIGFKTVNKDIVKRKKLFVQTVFQVIDLKTVKVCKVVERKTHCSNSISRNIFKNC